LIVDFNSILRGFATTNFASSWIRLDFKHHRIKPTHYSIRTRTECDYNHPRSWILEGLADGGEWLLLDCRTGNTELSGPRIVRTFSIRTVREVRSVRLQQTGPDSSNHHYLVLKSLELFGGLGDLSPSIQ
jgi:hypothetical protein